MKKRACFLALATTACLLLPACATTNLARWGWDASSKIDEPHGEVSAAVVKPVCTFIGLPVAFALDVAFFPFQAIFGVYPYGDSHMVPDAKD